MSQHRPDDPDWIKAEADALSAENLRDVAAEVASHFPPPRLATELVLLEVSPNRAHAYWNIDVEEYRAARAHADLAHAPLVLRLYDITDGTPPEKAITAFDVEVQGVQGHWYLDLWKDGRTHCADLGLRSPDGRLFTFIRSNEISTPRASESPDYQHITLDITGPKEPASPADNAPQPMEQTLLAERREDRSAAAALSFPGPQSAAPPERLQDDVQAYFDRAAELAASVPVNPPWQGHEPVLPSGGPPADSTASTPAAWPSAEMLESLVPAGIKESAAAPVSADEPASPDAQAIPAQPPPKPSQKSSVASLDQYVSLSSFEQGRREVALEVNVELHIHGRAKPGTELTLYGQPVPLRPDGTFSLRKPLPHGAVVVPLLAVEPPRAGPET